MGLQYFKIYKPFGVLSQFTKEVDSHATLADLHPFPKDVYPIGRLDKDSEGLLLLSNDKKLVDRLLNPNSKVKKTYLVQVEGTLDRTALDRLEEGVEIKVKSGKYHLTAPCQVQIINEPDIPERTPPIRFRKNSPTSWAEITIHEGKNRQVRKMFAKVGFPVLRLVRFSIGNIELNQMKIGEVKIMELKNLNIQ